jgi:hypothetical protein
VNEKDELTKKIYPLDEGSSQGNGTILSVRFTRSIYAVSATHSDEANMRPCDSMSTILRIGSRLNVGFGSASVEISCKHVETEQKQVDTEFQGFHSVLPTFEWGRCFLALPAIVSQRKTTRPSNLLCLLFGFAGHSPDRTNSTLELCPMCLEKCLWQN